ncbi:MAG: acyl-CoA dehydrogenase family protein [Planctomycetota bacterium]
MSQSSTFDALEAARAISSELERNATHGEKEGQLAPASVDALAESGMLSLWRPKGLGGHECDPVAYALAAEEVARADTAAAWLMHGVSACWFDFRMAQPELIDEILATGPVPVLGETFNKPMTAVAADGGLIVSGATPFASGSKLADWIGCTAVADGRFLLAYHPRTELRIEEDWDSLGLRGTASNTIVAEDVFVPSHRVIDLMAPVERGPHFEGALYRMPEGLIPVAVAATSLGALRSALDAASEVAERKTPFASNATLKHRPLAQLQFGRALARYRAARAYLHATVRLAFEDASRGESFDVQGKADLFLAYAHTQQECADAVRLLGKAVGASSIYKGNPIERAWRDAEVISHHAFGAEGRYASVAQAYWGLDVDFPLMAMD